MWYFTHTMTHTCTHTVTQIAVFDVVQSSGKAKGFLVIDQFYPCKSLQPGANSARESQDYKVTRWAMKCINHRMKSG